MSTAEPESAKDSLEKAILAITDACGDERLPASFRHELWRATEPILAEIRVYEQWNLSDPAKIRKAITEHLHNASPASRRLVMRFASSNELPFEIRQSAEVALDQLEGDYDYRHRRTSALRRMAVFSGEIVASLWRDGQIQTANDGSFAIEAGSEYTLVVVLRSSEIASAEDAETEVNAFRKPIQVTAPFDPFCDCELAVDFEPREMPVHPFERGIQLEPHGVSRPATFRFTIPENCQEFVGWILLSRHMNLLESLEFRLSNDPGR